MKVFKTLTFLLCISSGLYSQNSTVKLGSREKKGDRFFNLFAYNDALKAYQFALDQNKNVGRLILKVAETYRMLNMPEAAAEHYIRVIDNSLIIKPIHKLHLAQALSASGDYEQARIWFENYQKEGVQDSRAARNLDIIDNLNSLVNDSMSFHINKLNINSHQSDFSPMYYNDGIVFVSSRTNKKQASSMKKKSNFLDLYYSLEHEDGTNASPEQFHRNVNTQLHEGPTAFYDNYTKMIFTRNNFNNGKKSESSDGTIKLNLYQSKYNDNNWSKPTELPFNNDEYSVGHPTITNDGKILFFASDMPGGYGGTDIYMATFSNNNWGVPLNLGSKVNTEGNEVFPFYHEPTKMLYFSSNGLGGLGGLDVYSYDSLEGSDPKNLGYPINTNSDDFGFILSERGDSGYLSSNRKGGEGDDDIYHFSIQYNIMDLMVYDEQTNQPISSSIIKLFESGSLISMSRSNPEGEAFFSLNPKKKYVLSVQKAGYQKVEILLDITQIQYQDYSLIKVPLNYEDVQTKMNAIEVDSVTNKKLVLVGGELRDLDHLQAINQVDDTGLVLLNVGNNQTLMFYELNNLTGIQKFTLNENHILKFKNGQLVGDGVNIKLGENENRVQTIYKLSDLGFDVKYVEIKNIYYDLNKSLIRNDASVELDKIVNLFSQEPALQVKFIAYTDSRGSLSYNKDLSMRRAKAAKAYLISEGVDSQKILIDYYGEEKLINDCGDDTNCTEQQHQLNRRTEILIIYK